MTKFWLCVLAVIFLATSAVQATELAGTTPGEPRVLTGDDIKNEIAGNTIAGMSEGYWYEEYLKPDGRIRAEGYFGRWWVSGNKLCFDYDKTNSADGCWGVALKGKTLYWVNSDGSLDAETAELIRGNPKKL